MTALSLFLHMAAFAGGVLLIGLSVIMIVAIWSWLFRPAAVPAPVAPALPDVNPSR